jgi:hypothetical protein
MKKIEEIILLMMWIGALISYPIALYQNYNLLVSDYFGIAALVVLAFINFTKPSILLKALSIVLLIGSFNLISFVYFINIVVEFGVAAYVSPGIQLISSFLLVILLIVKRRKVVLSLHHLLGGTDGEREVSKENLVENFKQKFQSLSLQEIEERLKFDLQEEAKLALLAIQKEKKTKE